MLYSGHDWLGGGDEKNPGFARRKRERKRGQGRDDEGGRWLLEQLSCCGVVWTRKEGLVCRRRTSTVPQRPSHHWRDEK